MKWVLRIVLGLLALVAIAIGALFVLRPLEPPLEIVDAGETGRRINEGGVFGNYFPSTDGEPAPGVLLLGGSEGGLGSASRRMALGLQEAGYSVLQLGFYRGEGQPRDLVLVPLETFELGLDWLKRQSEVDAERLGVVGASKGAEAGLILAARRSDVDAAVLGAPSSVSWEGINWAFGGVAGESSWSLGGEPYPFLRYGRFDGETGVYSVYAGGLEALDGHPEAVIPVENGAGPVLLICGEDDTLWPSCPMARQIEARAAAKGGPPVTLLAYEDAGHAVFGIPVPADNPSYEKLASLGGSADGNAAARLDGWPRLVVFLKTHLGE
ncbi:MAG: acyl-CoA thioester hydrolase/BAAT C-terminal domain-containing protein [Pseudomonadota bacterium]